MRLNRTLTIALVAALLGSSHPALAQDETEPAVVMLVGVYRFANPGLDVVNIEADDVTSPKRQKEIASLNARLAAFRPTVIAVEEVSADSSLESPTFAAWRAGQRSDSRNERDQIAFRLAAATGARIAAIDVNMPLPFGPLMEAAEQNAPDVMARVLSIVQTDADATSGALASGTIADTLAVLNSPEALQRATSLYYIPLAVSPDGGATLPGVEVASTWHLRNLRICVRLMSLTKPGERVVVLYGASHIPPLTQCLAGAGIRIEDPLPYLAPAR